MDNERATEWARKVFTGTRRPLLGDVTRVMQQIREFDVTELEKVRAEMVRRHEQDMSAWDKERGELQRAAGQWEINYRHADAACQDLQGQRDALAAENATLRAEANAEKIRADRNHQDFEEMAAAYERRTTERNTAETFLHRAWEASKTMTVSHFDKLTQVQEILNNAIIGGATDDFIKIRQRAKNAEQELAQLRETLQPK